PRESAAALRICRRRPARATRAAASKPSWTRACVSPAPRPRRCLAREARSAHRVRFAGATLAGHRVSVDQRSSGPDDGQHPHVDSQHEERRGVERRAVAAQCRAADGTRGDLARRPAGAAGGSACALGGDRPDRSADRSLVGRVAADFAVVGRLARMAKLARCAQSTLCARGTRDARGRGGRSASLAGAASGVRSNRRPRRAGLDAAEPVRACPLPGAPASADRSVLRPIGAVFLRRYRPAGASAAVGARPVQRASAIRTAVSPLSWLDFAHPWALVLAPLAALPLWRPRTGLLTFSYVSWLPPDRLGRLAAALWRGLAVLAMLGMVLSLAGPGIPQTEVIRTGH